MKIQTRDFGEIEISSEDIINFEGAIYGFEGYKKFVFLFQEDISEHFVWLQSIEEPQLCFILVAPEVVKEDYSPSVPSGLDGLIGQGDYMCWLIVVIKEKFEQMTVNLKSPIVVNPATKRAAQVILEDNYSIHHPLISKKEGE